MAIQVTVQRKLYILVGKNTHIITCLSNLETRLQWLQLVSKPSQLLQGETPPALNCPFNVVVVASGNVLTMSTANLLRTGLIIFDLPNISHSQGTFSTAATMQPCLVPREHILLRQRLQRISNSGFRRKSGNLSEKSGLNYQGEPFSPFKS